MKDFEIFYDNDPEQIKRLKHAVADFYHTGTKVQRIPLHPKWYRITLGGRTAIQQTTLQDCDCSDFKKRRKPCQHMMALAIYEGAFDTDDPAVEKVRNLSDKAYAILAHDFWYGYYNEEKKKKDIAGGADFTLKALKEIEAQDIIRIDGDPSKFATLQGYTYSDYTKQNLAQVTFAIYSDPRYAG